MFGRGGANEPLGVDRATFERFTKRAKGVLSLAEEEARHFNHNYIGTEHLLLGLVREGNGVAARVLSNLGVDLERVRMAVEFIIGRGDRIVLGDIGLTPRCKKVLELAADEARRLNHDYIGTEHLLLGLLREAEGIAAGTLESLGVNLKQVRTQTIHVLETFEHRRGADLPTAEPSGPKSKIIACRIDDRDFDAIDALVEAGIRATRSDAAAWLIRTGIESQRPLFERVYATVAEIRRLRSEAQTLAQEVAVGDSATLPAAEPPTDTPPTDTPPTDTPSTDTPSTDTLPEG